MKPGNRSDKSRKRIVRLRTLLGYYFPESDGGSGAADAAEKSGVELRRLDGDNIDVSLSLAPPPQDGDQPPRPLVGAIAAISLGELIVNGQLSYSTQGSQDSSELSISGKALDAVVREIDLGAAKLSAAAVRIDAIEDGRLSFEGLHPRAFVATIRGLRLIDVELRMGS